MRGKSGTPYEFRYKLTVKKIREFSNVSRMILTVDTSDQIFLVYLNMGLMSIYRTYYKQKINAIL